MRSWQKVVSGSETTPTVNGDGLTRVQDDSKHVKSPAVPTTPVNKLVTQKSVKSSLSQGQLGSKPNTPTLQQTVNSDTAVQTSVKRSQSSSHVHPSSAKRKCRSPGPSSQPGTPDSICSQSSRTSYSTIPHTYSSHSLSDLHSTTDKKKLQRTRSNESLSKEQRSSDIHDIYSLKDSPSPTAEKSKSGQNGIIRNTTDLSPGETSTHSIETKRLTTTIRLKSPAVLNGETPKKRGRGRPPKNKPQIIASSTFEPPPVNGSTPISKNFVERKNVHLALKTDSETLRNDKFISMTPKVKNTAELMQSLLEKNNLSVGKDTVRQISANLIQKESDEDRHSVVPSGARPRQQKKKGAKNELIPPSTPSSLTKTKTEMVQKFLESSVTDANPDDLSPLKYELPRTESPGNASTSFEDSLDGNQDSRKHYLMDSNKHDQTQSSSVIGGEISPLKTETFAADSVVKPGCSTDSQQQTPGAERPLTLEEIYSKYPPLDLENFVFDNDTYEVADPVDITESDIQRINNEHWSGVNGCQDMFSEWKDWSQTLSLSSYNGDPLHILPYVCVDD